MKEWFMVGLGGMIGTLARHGIQLVSLKILGNSFPFGTLIVNLLGCLLVGVGWSITNRFGWMQGNWELAYRVGFLGGLTTFSSYGLDIFRMSHSDRPSMALLVLGSHLLLGLAMVWLGAWIGDSLTAGSVKGGV